MKNINTGVLQKSLLKVLPNKTFATIVEVLFLFLIGMLAVTLHAKLRMPMKLPGKQGVLFMFLLISAYSFSRFRFATLISCAGASILLFANVLAFDDPFMAIEYLLLGCVMDMLLNGIPKLQAKIWYVALVCGISWMIIPLSREIIHLTTGYFYPSLMTGLLFPVSTHFAAGFTGGLIGAAAAKGIKTSLAKKE
jgi:hypothetical protein